MYYIVHYDTALNVTTSAYPLPDHNYDEAIAEALSHAQTFDWQGQCIEIQVCTLDGIASYTPLAYVDEVDGETYVIDLF